jgi:hypothetical protein
MSSSTLHCGGHGVNRTTPKACFVKHCWDRNGVLPVLLLGKHIIRRRLRNVKLTKNMLTLVLVRLIH